MAASVSFTYDGGLVVQATITGATIGITYRIACDDANSTPVQDTAVATTLVLTVTDIGDPAEPPYQFLAIVWRIDTGVEVGVTVFKIGNSDEYAFEAGWNYNASRQVIVTFPSVVGTNYRVYSLDENATYLSAITAGTGSSLAITVNATADFAGGFVGILVDNDTGNNLSTRLFSQGAAGVGNLGNPSVSLAELCSRSWRFVVADLEGATISLLDGLASERMVTPKLNEPLEVTGTVPSDNPEINMLHTDNLPFLAEGVRQLYCFRRESNSSPYFTIRASTLIMQVGDASRSDDARSRFTAWDPWQYLFSRPVLQSSLAVVVDVQGGQTTGVNGDLIPAQQLLYPASMTADAIILDILAKTISFGDATAPAAAKGCFLDVTSGTVETCGTFVGGWPVQQGTSVGQALKDMVDTGYMDIVLTPIYDPINRPGILCELNIYSQGVVNGVITKLGAGSYNYAAQFAWDRPGRSLVGFDNLYDGTGRANFIQYYNGQGGPAVTPSQDAASIALYGEYWAQQFFPGNTQAVAVESISAMQLALRKTVKETLTVNPAPERGPEPFVDYYLGDGVPVFIGKPQQGAYALGDSSSRQSLPPGYTGVPPSPNPVALVWQRVYGIPVSIDDNGVETVRELIVGPVGAPPPVGGGNSPSPGINSQVAINTTRRINRSGRIGK